LKPIFAVDTIDNAENQQVKSKNPVDNTLTAVDKIGKRKGALTRLNPNDKIISHNNKKGINNQ
jgi:hypothetical protein